MILGFYDFRVCHTTRVLKWSCVATVKLHLTHANRETRATI